MSLTKKQAEEFLADWTAPEREGIRIFPHNENEVVIDIIHNHEVLGYIVQKNKLFDSIRYSALGWMAEEHEALTAKVTEIEQENAQLKERLALLRQQHFGTSSEQHLSEPEAPQAMAEPQPPQPEAGPPSKKPEPSQAGRKPLPPHLPRERVTYEIPQQERLCPCCNGAVHPLGEEITEQLTVIPMRVKVVQHVRKKYVCRDCGKFITAQGAKPLIEKSSYASPDLLAHVACAKFQFGLPFYRQETIFEQAGLEISRTTLANLMIGCADKLVALYEALRLELMTQPIIHADETTVQVLKETGRKAQTKSYLWLYRSYAQAAQQVVLFDYQKTRAGEHPERFLRYPDGQPFRGYLQVDGYSGYNGLSEVQRVGCMAHVRRKFAEIIKALPDQATNTPAHHAIDLIGRLYEVERRMNDSPHRIRYRVRQAESAPILQEFKSWLDDMQPRVAPKSPLGRAVGYALDQWDFVSRYVEDGRLAIDNNIAERDVKSVVIGRKNWLFADSEAGMLTNAVMYSLIQTATANGLNPYEYLKFVIETMPTLRSASEVEQLLPWNMAAPMTEEDRAAA